MTAEPEHLWNALQQFVPADALPTNRSLQEVINNWITTAGYPVVNVLSRGNDVVLSQVRNYEYDNNHDKNKNNIITLLDHSHNSKILSALG